MSGPYTESQLAQMAPHRGLKAQTKTEASRLRKLGFNPIFTEVGWSCNVGEFTVECEDSTLFLSE